MSQQNQRALVLTEKHGGEFRVSTIPKYRLGPGEILIKIHSVALNPVDWKIQKDALFPMPEYPAILGTDIAGDVDEVGEGVDEFKPGDRVFGQGQFVNKYGGFQQYAVMLASTTARIPQNTSYDEAATIPVALTIAYVGLYNQSPHGLGFDAPVTSTAKGRYAGIPIVVLGGASSVGQITIQLAKISGFSPIIVTASEKNTSYLQALGADTVLSRNLSTADLTSAIAKITSKPITAVIDSISLPQTQKLGVDLLASGGKLLTVLASTLTEADLEGAKSIIEGLGLLRIPQNIALNEEMYHDHLSGWVEQGWIKPNVVEVLEGGLEGIKEGLERLYRGEVTAAKLVARPQEGANL